MENSMVCTSATQFIRRPCFPDVQASPFEAHVLRLGITLEEDRETQKIPLNYALNYAPRVASDGKFHGSTSATQFIRRPCFLDVQASPCEAYVLRLGITLEEDRETQKIPLNYALNYAPGVASDGKFYGKYLRYSVYRMPTFSRCVRESF